MLDLERLYDKYAQGLFAFLLSLTRNEADTHDLLHELFVKLATRPELLEGVRDERAYLHRMAYNLVTDSSRRQAVRQRNYERMADESSAWFAPVTDPDERVQFEFR